MALYKSVYYYYNASNEDGRVNLNLSELLLSHCRIALFLLHACHMQQNTSYT